MHYVGRWKTSGKSISNPENGLWLHHLERSAAQHCCLSSVRWQTSSHFTWLHWTFCAREHHNKQHEMKIWESLNRWGWRTLLEIAKTNSSAYCRCDKSRLLRAISAWGLDILRYWDCAKSLHHLFQCLKKFPEKMWFVSSWTLCHRSQSPKPCIHPGSNLPYCLLTQAVLPQFVYEGILEQGVQFLTRDKIENIWYSALIHQASQLMKEGHQAGQVQFVLCNFMLTIHNQRYVFYTLFASSPAQRLS